MGANGPNHLGLEKWKKTIFRAAKARRPVSAGSFSLRGLTMAGFGLGEETATFASGDDVRRGTTWT